MTKDKATPVADEPQTEVVATTTENLYVFPNYNGKGVQIKVTAKDREDAVKKADKLFKERTK